MKKIFCDRCGEEIQKKEVGLLNMFDDIGKKSDSLIIEPTLCEKCKEGFKKIIDETNEKIKRWIKRK